MSRYLNFPTGDLRKSERLAEVADELSCEEFFELLGVNKEDPEEMVTFVACIDNGLFEAALVVETVDDEQVLRTDLGGRSARYFMVETDLVEGFIS